MSQFTEKKLFVIGLVWPEPKSSAAGTRMLQILQLFIEAGYAITFASAAAKGPYSHPLQEMGIAEQEIQLNNASFDELLKNINPQIVLFDRYVTEEQYGWRVTEQLPGALKILDTEDLHCLREIRRNTLKTEAPEVWFTEMAKREIAAIYRCDLSLMITQNEIDILQQKYQVPESLLWHLPFLEQIHAHRQWKSFEAQKNFVFIGNFLHAPNVDALQVLKKEIWPGLRKILPQAELHIYGAYASNAVNQLHNAAEKFIIKGRAAEAQQTLAQYRVLLAPLRFGAGAKGKLIDAMHAGTPSVSTPVGAEGMLHGQQWPGALASDWHMFIQKSAALYTQADLWRQAQQQGSVILKENFDINLYKNKFLEKINTMLQDLDAQRAQNFFGQILQHHQHLSTKYLSRWIELKNHKD